MSGLTQIRFPEIHFGAMDVGLPHRIQAVTRLHERDILFPDPDDFQMLNYHRPVGRR